MKIRLSLLGAGVLALVVVIWWAQRRTPEGATTGSVVPAPQAALSPASTLPPSPAAEQPPAPQPLPPTEPSPAPAVAMPVPASPEAQAEVEKVGLMLRDFRTLFGENPVGTNAEIMKSIMGGNAKGATLGPPQNMRVNDNGELLDQWGTPIFFHALSRTQMEIRSAGPDGVMWNGDDVLLK